MAQGVCLGDAMPVTVQVVDTSSMAMQLNTADMNAVSPEGNRMGHVGVSLRQVGHYFPNRHGPALIQPDVPLVELSLTQHS